MVSVVFSSLFSTGYLFLGRIGTNAALAPSLAVPIVSLVLHRLMPKYYHLHLDPELAQGKEDGQEFDDSHSDADSTPGVSEDEVDAESSEPSQQHTNVVDCQTSEPDSAAVASEACGVELATLRDDTMDERVVPKNEPTVTENLPIVAHPSSRVQVIEEPCRNVKDMANIMQNNRFGSS